MIEELENLKKEVLQLEAQKDSIPDREFDEKITILTEKLVNLMDKVLSKMEENK